MSPWIRAALLATSVGLAVAWPLARLTRLLFELAVRWESPGVFAAIPTTIQLASWALGAGAAYLTLKRHWLKTLAQAMVVALGPSLVNGSLALALGQVPSFLASFDQMGVFSLAFVLAYLFLKLSKKG